MFRRKFQSPYSILNTEAVRTCETSENPEGQRRESRSLRFFSVRPDERTGGAANTTARLLVLAYWSLRSATAGHKHMEPTILCRHGL